MVIDGEKKGILIEEIKCGISKGGVACGPVPGCVNISVRFSKDGKSGWISNSEFDGIPNFYMSEKDMHDILMKDADMEDSELKFIQDAYVGELDGIDLSDYCFIAEGIRSRPDSEYASLLKLMVALTTCDWDEYHELESRCIGRYADEIEYSRDILSEFDEDNEYRGTSSDYEPTR